MMRIVTDSTSYLPDHIVNRYGITVVPLKVQLGHETYDETSGISNREFYQRLIITADFPTTSQPTSAEFKSVFQKIRERHPGAQILVVTVSSKLSGTYNSAIKAANQVPHIPITVFDSLSAAMGTGLMVIAAAEMASAGLTLVNILSRLEQMRREISIVLMVDSLEYLRRGGRISAAAAFLGTLLDAKPILTVTGGRIEPLGRARTRPKAIARMIAELKRHLVTPDQMVQAGVMHVAAETEMEKLALKIQEQFNVTRLFTSELGPVIGTHVGPGTLGAGICPEP